MANTFGKHILIQAEDPLRAADFYVRRLGFSLTGDSPDLVSLGGKHINLYIERGPKLGPVLEVTVESVAETRRHLLEQGCRVLKDEPQVPRCYIEDPFGLIYNLTT